MVDPRVVIRCLAAALLLTACATPDGANPAEKRAYALSVRESALAELYAERPEVREEVENAAGTVFYSNFSVHPGLLTFANGYGIVERRATGEQKHLRFTRFGIGPGLSVKGFYTLSIIENEELLTRLFEGSWVGGAYAEASFVFGDFGGGAAAAGVFADGIHGYLWTHTGFALEATLALGKISGDDELNETEAAASP